MVIERVYERVQLVLVGVLCRVKYPIQSSVNLLRSDTMFHL